MIQANELRLGNKVKVNGCYDGKILTFKRFDEDLKVAFFSDGSPHGIGEFLENIEGIPLSFEVFTDNIAITDVEAASNIKEEHMFAIKVSDRISLKWHKTRGVWIYIRNESYPLKHIEYLHQLQNLYADLKGQQLEIKFTDAQHTK